MDAKTIIFVLGSGRSGTSAVTGLISMGGAVLPEALIGNTPCNPKGHWEPVGAWKINEMILSRANSSYFDDRIGMDINKYFDPDGRERCVAMICRFLLAYPSGQTILVKEPRISVLFGIWSEAARLLGLEIRCIFSVRDPAEVIASHVTRDHIEPERAEGMWIKYNVLAERYSRALPRCFVHYPSWISDWKSEIERWNTTCNLTLCEPSSERVGAFLDLGLYRERTDATAFAVSGKTQAIYEQLHAAARTLAPDWSILDAAYPSTEGR